MDIEINKIDEEVMAKELKMECANSMIGLIRTDLGLIEEAVAEQKKCYESDDPVLIKKALAFAIRSQEMTVKNWNAYFDTFKEILRRILE